MRLINIYEVSHITGLNDFTIRKYLEEGHFPVPVQFNEYCSSILWADEEIQLWIYNVLTKRDYEIRDLERDNKQITAPRYQNESWEHLHHFISNDSEPLNSPNEEHLPKQVKIIC
tara:strand:+ start:176 stop:520 length:345 start_codon:yes stop_codon:yes gene_type:complete